MLSTATDAEFLEYLSIPCVFLAKDHTIVRANASAKRLLTKQDQTSIIGLSILNTNLLTTCLEDESSLKEILIQLSGANRNTEASIRDQASRLSVSERGPEDWRTISLTPHSEARVKWQVSECIIGNVFYFNLTASQIQSKTSWRDTHLSKDEEFELLLQVSAPSRNVDYYVNVVSPDCKRTHMNESGRILQATLTKRFEDGSSLGLFNDTFTAKVEFSAAAGPRTLKDGHSNISIRQGVEDPDSGERTILETTCTMLNSPFTDRTMGVLVQAREGQEWSNYLQRMDIFTRTNTIQDDRKPVMVRSMLNDGTVDYFSDSWEIWTGCGRKNLLSAWKDWIHPQDLPRIHEATASSLSSGQPCEYQIRCRRDHTFSYHFFQERFAPLKDEHGNIIRWYYISTDIHDLVIEREAAQRTSNHLFRIVNSISAYIVFEIDETWKVCSAEGALKVTALSGEQYTANDYVGKDVHDLCLAMKPDGVQELEGAFFEIFHGLQKKVQVDYSFGGQHLRTIVVANYEEGEEVDEAQRKLYGLTMDVSAEHGHELAKHQLVAMKETERMKAQFLANISHELRTPIAGLVGILELFNDTPLNALQTEYLRVLETSAQNLLVIVNDILDLSRAETTEVTIAKIPFDYKIIIQDVCKVNEALITKKGLKSNFKPLHFEEKVLGDPGRVRQILLNLLGNAIKFTSRGSITVETTYERTEKSIRLTTIIEDTGIGIDSETLRVLFRPFVQADQSTTRMYGGSGLGLSIARKFAHKMGGDVTLESTKGVGTKAVFTLELEYAQVDAISILPLQSPRRASLKGTHSFLVDKNQWRQQCHILVVEDNKINQKVVMSHLRKLGFSNTHCVENGAEAVEYVKDAISNDIKISQESQAEEMELMLHLPDLILMDCQMPILDGYNATKQLRNDHHYDRPIIALTASAIKGDKESCLAVGMNDHLAKPISQKTLNEALEKWILHSES